MRRWRMYLLLYWNMLLKKLGLRKDKDGHDGFIY